MKFLAALAIVLGLLVLDWLVMSPKHAGAGKAVSPVAAEGADQAHSRIDHALASVEGSGTVDVAGFSSSVESVNALSVQAQLTEQFSEKESLVTAGTRAMNPPDGEDRFEDDSDASRSFELEIVDFQGVLVLAATHVTFWVGDRKLPVAQKFSDSAPFLEVHEGRGFAQGLPPELLGVRVHLLGRERAEELTLDLRMQPREPVRLVVEAPRETPIKVEVLGTFSVTDLSGIWGDPSLDRLHSLRNARDVWNFTGQLNASFRSSAGAELAFANMKVSGNDNWTTSWTAGVQSSSSESSSSSMAILVPADAIEVELSATGYRSMVLALDTRRINAGLPKVVILRRGY